MKLGTWVAGLSLLAVAWVVAACASEDTGVTGMKVLNIEEGTASANGTWKRACEETDDGVQQVVLEFSGRNSLISTQSWSAPATECTGTPDLVDNATGKATLETESKEVTWLNDTSPAGLPDALLATRMRIALDQAVDSVDEYLYIAVIDEDASPDALYASGSQEADVTLDENGYPDELNSVPYEKD
jgi:hypothetical protein